VTAARHDRPVGCLLCGRRQVDPVSGPSDWVRGVSRGEQVLVCPDCCVPGWDDVLDRCDACGSTRLVKRLGEVLCRSCGAVDRVAGAPGRTSGTPDRAAPRSDLAADVSAAVDRLLRGDRPDGS
jgi:hypothetical protein